MSDKLKRIGNTLTGLATLATFHAYYLSMQDNSMKKLVETYRSEKEALGRTIVKLAEDNTITEAIKLRYLKNTENEIARLQKILNNLNQGKHKTAAELISEDKVDWSRDTNESLSELHRLVNEYRNSGSGAGSSSISQLVDNFNNNLIEEFKQVTQSYLDWVNSLSMTQQGAIAHILASITILLCLSSLITIFYSNYLIKRFNIESKFPRFAKYISLRRTFQQYYFLINTIIIIFFLFIIIFINIYAFINS